MEPGIGTRWTPLLLYNTFFSLSTLSFDLWLAHAAVNAICLCSRKCRIPSRHQLRAGTMPCIAHTQTKAAPQYEPLPLQHPPWGRGVPRHDCQQHEPLVAGFGTAGTCPAA